MGRRHAPVLYGKHPDDIIREFDSCGAHKAPSLRIWPSTEERASRERLDLSILLRLPRITGGPEEAARDIRNRAIAKSRNHVYVSAYVRRRPIRTRHHAKPAA